MKKMFVLLIVLAIMASLTACGFEDTPFYGLFNPTTATTSPSTAGEVVTESTVEDGSVEEPSDEWEPVVLTGVWQFNEELVPLAEQTESDQVEQFGKSARVTLGVFTVNGVVHSKILWRWATKGCAYSLVTLDYDGQCAYMWYSDYKSYPGWLDDSYRTLDFTGNTTPVESEELYNWFILNATQISE